MPKNTSFQPLSVKIAPKVISYKRAEGKLFRDRNEYSLAYGSSVTV